MINIKKLPWRTTVICSTALIFLVSPLGRQIYNDLKESNEKQKKELSNQKIEGENEKLLQEFSKMKTSDELSLPNLTNQKVVIKYKATKIDEISLIFNIAPYTRHTENRGRFNIYFVDNDGFTFHSFSISESAMSNIVGDNGELIGGRYETSIYMDLTKFRRLEKIKVGTNISQERLSMLSGEFDKNQSQKAQEIRARIEAYKNKVNPVNLYEYKIKAGDTLYRLALRHGVKESDLLKINEGVSSRSVKVGDSILLPQDNLRRPIFPKPSP